MTALFLYKSFSQTEDAHHLSQCADYSENLIVSLNCGVIFFKILGSVDLCDSLPVSIVVCPINDGDRSVSIFSIVYSIV